ncbi:MAG: hypothetical protein J6J36_06845 [Clostridia bacterium]|nr:hypothetical protein [Clostridia bacterium]
MKKITKVETQKIFKESRVCLLYSKFAIMELDELQSKVETADERLDETNESYVDKFWFGWKKSIKVTDNYVKFENDSRVDLIPNNEYYYYKGNYGVDYLVLISQLEKCTIIYGVEKE